MANFAYIKGSLAGWANNTTLSQADLWQLDQNQHDAINGVGGGTYAPTGTITIGGSGISISGPALFSGTFNATTGSFSSHLTAFGNVIFGATSTTAQFNGTLQVVGSSQFDDAFAAYGDAEFHGSTTFFGTSTFDATATLNGTTTLGAGGSLTANGSATFGATVSVAGVATFGSSGSFAGTLTAYSRIRLSSSGRVTQNLVSDTLSGDVSFSVDGGARTYMGYTCLLFTDLGGAARIIQLYADGAIAGDVVEIKNATAGTAYNLTVKGAAGGTIGTTGQGEKYTYLFDGTDWISWSDT